MNLPHSRPMGAESERRGPGPVFIVDGDAVARRDLETLIRAAGLQVETFASAEEFIALPRASCPCCLLVEQHLPGAAGVDLQDAVADRADMTVVFMSSDAHPREVVRAMKAGAVEFLSKPFPDGMVLGVIRSALERSSAIHERLLHLRGLHEQYALLSRRERQVMAQVVLGRLNKQVAADLRISEITVKAHRGQVMRKMQVRSLADLVRMAADLQSGGAQGLRPEDDVQVAPGSDSISLGSLSHRRSSGTACRDHVWMTTRSDARVGGALC